MPISPLTFELPAVLLGLIFGSFLNVCISRLPKHLSINQPRSHCPVCQATIRWYDNIPLLSFLLLRARCRNCKAKIPWRYPVVELAVGLWFFESGWRLWQAWYVEGYVTVRATLESTVVGTADSIALAILGFFLIGLLVMDWQTHTLPDAFTLTGTLIGFLLLCVQAALLGPNEDAIKFDPKHSLRLSSPGSFVAKGNVFMTGPEHVVLGRVLAICGAAGIILFIRLVYKAIRDREGLGLGDAKLMALIAAFLGFAPAMLALFVGILLCAAYAITLLARRKASGLTHLPLGTFLCFGGLFAALFGTPLIDWYTSLLH